MNTLARLTVAGGAAAAAAALFASPAFATTAHAPHHPKAVHPVFVQNDNTSGNTVFVYNRKSDGRLQRVGHAATDGLGGQVPDSVVDHLASQGSLTYDRAHHLLYAVNAGSNTVTVFAVRGDQLQRRQIVRSGGSFPVSVAVHGSRVAVLNADGGGSVQSYLNLRGELIPISDQKLGLSTTVPPGTPAFVETPGQVAFTPDGHSVIVTTKANGSDIDVLPVGAFGSLGTPVVDPDVTGSSANVPFAVTFDRSGALIVAEAGDNSVARFALNHDRSITLRSRVATTGQATCWIVAAKPGGRFYVDNAGSATISTVSRSSTGLALDATTSSDPGVTDATVTPDGRNLYVQTGANGVVDEFSIAANGKLAEVGSITVPGAVGGEGIASA